jgi:hypothetical protein
MEGMFARVIVHPKAAGKPGPAFFGLAGTQSTLQVRSAEMVSGELHLEGAVTVFEAFSTFSGPVRFQLGGRTIEFHPDQHGAAVGPDGSFRVKNASPFGVVYGGSMEFEATFPRAYRLRQPGPPGTETNAAHEFVLPLTMQLGAARHDATVRVKL